MNKYFPGQPVAFRVKVLLGGVIPNPPLSNVVLTLCDATGVKTELSSVGDTTGLYETDWLAPFGPYGLWRLQWSTSGVAITSNGYTEDRFQLAARNF